MPVLNAEGIWALIESVRSGKPRTVHCFMNAVAANDCANALLAAGARPVMADCADECAEITAKSGALVLNMGTFSPEKGRAMLLSGRAADDAGIPVVIDPVGLQASSLRREWFGRFMNELRVSAVKGNLSEIREAAGETCAEAGELAKLAAEKLGCTVLVTGGQDFLSDGGRVFRFSNGTPYMAAVTGTGCMTGALIGAFAAEAEPMAACAAAVSLMNISGELAAADFRGTGTFRVRLMDMLSQLTCAGFTERLKMTELT